MSFFCYCFLERFIILVNFFFFLAETEKNEKLLEDTNLVETVIQKYFARFGLKAKIKHSVDNKFIVSVSYFSMLL